MKRRVRGVLHRKWFAPLLASALFFIPVAAVFALCYFLVWPKAAASEVLDLAAMGISTDGSMDLLLTAGMLLGGGLKLNFAAVRSLGVSLLAPLVLYLFVVLPMRTSLSSYFLALLRGKKPSVGMVFDCFSKRYGRALCGMLLRALWLVLWAAVAFVCPFVLYTLCQRFVTPITEMLGLINSFYVWGGLILLCLVWFAVFALVFINRAIAFSFTPIVLAAHPRLNGASAPRLSRRLTRGCKWRLIGLYASFLTWYSPAIVSMVVYASIGYLSTLLGLTDVYVRYIRIFLLIVTGLNLLVTFFIAPYVLACRHAFYIERKREALMDEEVTPDDFGKKQRKGQTAQPEEKPAEEEKE